MKKLFEEPSVNVQAIDLLDVIAASTECNDDYAACPTELPFDPVSI